MRQAAAKQRELTMRLSPHKLSSKFLQDELQGSGSKMNGKTARNLSHYDALKQEHHMSTGRRRFGGSCMNNDRGLFDMKTADISMPIPANQIKTLRPRGNEKAPMSGYATN